MIRCLEEITQHGGCRPVLRKPVYAHLAKPANLVRANKLVASYNKNYSLLPQAEIPVLIPTLDQPNGLI